MYIRQKWFRLIGSMAVGAVWSQAGPALAQSASGAQPPQHEHAGAPPDRARSDPQNMQTPREGSGTAWLPDATPMYAIHSTKGPWALMFHENAFVQYLSDSGPRGDDQVGSINWAMGMAGRAAAGGRLMFRGMFSAEPWTIRGCGYPDLLASGERCEGEKIHDRQHPHDLMMEIVASYDRPLTGGVRWQVYGGPVGEPALGPVAYPHRVSAMPNPLAPIAHHWFDSTHITYGVITGGVYAHRWKAEGSVFNGREPDAQRTDFDFDALDSVSGRVWILPTPRLALQLSAGSLKGAEAGEDGGPRLDVSRVSASATYHAAPMPDTVWATTMAWGRNQESGRGSNALLIETTLTLQDRDTLFARFEAARKTAHDLDLGESLEAFTISKLQGGYTRYLSAWKGLKSGIGAGFSAGFVPVGLRDAYGGRVNAGVAVFLTVRPAQMMTHAGHEMASPGAGHTRQ